MTIQQMTAILRDALDHAEATLLEAEWRGVYPPQSLGAVDVRSAIQKINEAQNALNASFPKEKAA
jgi:hypothetical protein